MGISVSTRKIKTSHILVKYKMASTKSVNVVRQVKPLLSVSKNEARLRVLANSNVKDTRVIDMLVVKGQQDLQEVVEKWAQTGHIMSKFFKESYEERPKDFMSKFLTGAD